MADLEVIFDLETFEKGGRRLFDGISDGRDPEDVRALVVEACRAKDSLDRLNDLVTLDGQTWATVEFPDAGESYVLKIDGVLREQRQARIVFKQLLAEIDRRRAGYGVDDDDEGGLSDL